MSRHHRRWGTRTGIIAGGTRTGIKPGPYLLCFFEMVGEILRVGCYIQGVAVEMIREVSVLEVGVVIYS
ncbi:MAG TPA: hypothetical protein VL485_00185 [Ktedonobacteraceae bacterium]|nr:hypothetical protein [Ktedonobacteraceae bacterium]